MKFCSRWKFDRLFVQSLTLASLILKLKKCFPYDSVCNLIELPGWLTDRQTEGLEGKRVRTRKMQDQLKAIQWALVLGKQLRDGRVTAFKYDIIQSFAKFSSSERKTNVLIGLRQSHENWQHKEQMTMKIFFLPFSKGPLQKLSACCNWVLTPIRVCSVNSRMVGQCGRTSHCGRTLVCDAGKHRRAM